MRPLQTFKIVEVLTAVVQLTFCSANIFLPAPTKIKMPSQVVEYLEQAARLSAEKPVDGGRLETSEIYSRFRVVSHRVTLFLINYPVHLGRAWFCNNGGVLLLNALFVGSLCFSLFFSLPPSQS